MSKTGHNDTCPCGSGKKYKQCCLKRGGSHAENAPSATIPKAMQDALVHHQSGRLQQAEAIYRRILQAKPDHADALHLLGMVSHQAGRNAIAIELIGKAISAKPSEPMYFNNLGMALETQGELGAAAESFRKALLLKPGYAKAHFNLGNTLRAQGKPDAAVASYRNALAYQPGYAEAHNNLGNALKDQGKLDAAVEHYRKALSLQPDYAEAHNNLGNALKDQGQLDGAVEHLNKAITLYPDFASAHVNLGNALKELKQLDAALASYSRAIAIQPVHPDAYFNQGNVLKDLNRLDAALASHDKAIALKPDYADAYINRGVVLEELKQPEAALASYDKAIAVKPEIADGHWNKALLLLLLGDFENGLEGYEWRWKSENLEISRRNFTQPLWLGKEPLAGKTILLHSEQGFGDTIQFCRYAKLVAGLGGRVVLEVKKPLFTLFSDLNGVSQLVENGSSLPTFDYHCPLLSLPLAFTTNMDSIPASTPYLTADASKVAQWQARLGAKPRVGLVWSGNSQHKNDLNRSVLFAELLNYLPDDFQYVSLQKELRDEDMEIFQSHPEILHYGDELDDFSDTAALCESMDVIISVDTSVAHLAGALGKKVWILLPFIPDWRWLLDRSDSPWYPTAKLYRQENIGDWDGVFEKVKSDLRSIGSRIQRDSAFESNRNASCPCGSGKKDQFPAGNLPRNFSKMPDAGFTYLGLLILLAIMGIVSAAALQVGVVTHRRVAEEALLNVGREFSVALESYRRATPAGQPDEPSTWQDLLKDPRFPGTVRHLRKLYHDPITGQQEWGILRSEESNRIVGVFSLSDAKPIKIANFDLRFQEFVGKSSYREWVFTGTQAGAVSSGGAKFTDPRDLMGDPPANPATDSPRAPNTISPLDLLN